MNYFRIKLKWYHVYFLLAGFDVLTISASLYLNHTVIDIYEKSVENNSRWASRVSHCSQLNELASSVNAPGNNAFESGDYLAEQINLDKAIQKFKQHVRDVRDEIQQNIRAESITGILLELDGIEEQVSLMHQKASVVLVDLGNNENDQPGIRMAEMDRCFSNSILLIGDLSDSLQLMQMSQFKIETLRAQRFGQYELLIVGIVFLISCVVTWYGINLAKHLEKKDNIIRKNEEQLALTLSATIEGIWDWNVQSDNITFSPTWIESLGYDMEDISKQFSFWTSIVHPEETVKFHKALNDHFAGHTLHFECEVRLLNKNGMYRWSYIRSKAVSRNKDGQPLRVVGTVIDISNRVRQSNLAMNRNRVYKQLASSVDLESILTTIVDGVEKYSTNNMRCSVLLLDKEMGALRHATGPSLPKFYNDAIDGFKIGPEAASCGTAAFKNCPVYIEDVMKHPHWVPLRELAKQANIRACWSVPIRSSDGCVLGTFAMYYSSPRLPSAKECELIQTSAELAGIVIEKFQTTEELNDTKLCAEAANRAKSEFLANMSHEIRTPMTAILGYVDILLDSVSKPEELDAARTIQRNGECLIDLINDILDLSKIEAGKLDVEKIICSPQKIITDVCSLMNIRAVSKGCPLNVRNKGLIPKTIKTDPTRLRQILINIVGNAIKFTENGFVEIVTRFVNHPDRGPQLQIDVVDTGVGIAKSNINALFHPFSQADNTTTRKFGGTGLGLTISKRLVELLGGEILVDSTLGHGTTFSITVDTGELGDLVQIPDNQSKVVTDNLQLFEKTDTPSASETDCPLENSSILVAEDGADNQRLIQFILKKAGAKVTLVDNGLAAVDLATRSIVEDNPFDVILMDMQMPVLDGYGATRKLRISDYSGPIIALTANAMTADREKCLDCGCDDYATKPLDKNKLIKLVASYARKNIECRNS